MLPCCRRLQDKNIWLHDSSLWDTVGRDDAQLNAHVETIRWADVGEQQQQQYSSTTATASHLDSRRAKQNSHAVTMPRASPIQKMLHSTLPSLTRRNYSNTAGILADNYLTV
jgi:hypothetical protein